MAPYMNKLVIMDDNGDACSSVSEAEFGPVSILTEFKPLNWTTCINCITITFTWSTVRPIRT